MPVDHPVIASLIPVILIIAAGYAVGRSGMVSRTAMKELSNLAFLVLLPCLLFRTMGKVQVQSLDFRPVAAYFIGVTLVFAGTLVVQGLNRRAVMLALACTFSNTIMIGIPLIGMAYGESGLVTLFTLYTLHTALLLTGATLVLEVAILREAAAGQDTGRPHRSLPVTLLLAVRNAIVHPVPLPIFAGMLYAQTGWGIPTLIDRPMQLLGGAFAPLALLMVGMTMAVTSLGAHVRSAIGLTLAKNLLMPVLVAGAGLALGVTGLPLVVVVVVSCLPAGANSLLFAQRYGVAQDTVTAAVGLGTFVALATVPVVMLLAARLPGM